MNSIYLFLLIPLLILSIYLAVVTLLAIQYYRIGKEMDRMVDESREKMKEGRK